MLEPPAGAAALRLTVACPVPPAGTVAVLSVTLDTVGVPVDGAAGESEPQLTVPTVIRIAASATYGVAHRLFRMDETSIHARGARDDPRKPCSSALWGHAALRLPCAESARCTDTLLDGQEHDSGDGHFRSVKLYNFEAALRLFRRKRSRSASRIVDGIALAQSMATALGCRSADRQELLKAPPTTAGGGKSPPDTPVQTHSSAANGRVRMHTRACLVSVE